MKTTTKRAIQLLTILAFIALSGCQKDISSDQTDVSEQISNLNEIANIEKGTKDCPFQIRNYLRIIQLGSIELMKRNDVRGYLLSLSDYSATLEDNSDYYVYLKNLNDIYAINGINLQNIMRESIILNGGSPKDVSLFDKYGFEYKVGDFTFDIRYFLPFRNTNFYGNMELPSNPDFGILLSTMT